MTLSGRVERTINNGLARQGVSSNFVPFLSSHTSNPFPKDIHLQHINSAEGAINHHQDSILDSPDRRHTRSVHLTGAVSFPRRRPPHLWSLRGGATASQRIHPHHLPCTFTRHTIGGMLTFSYSQLLDFIYTQIEKDGDVPLSKFTYGQAPIRRPKRSQSSRDCAVCRLDCAAATGRMDWRRKDQRRDSTPPFLTGASQLAAMFRHSATWSWCGVFAVPGQARLASEETSLAFWGNQNYVEVSLLALALAFTYAYLRVSQIARIAGASSIALERGRSYGLPREGGLGAGLVR